MHTYNHYVKILYVYMSIYINFLGNSLLYIAFVITKSIFSENKAYVHLSFRKLIKYLIT